MLGGTAGRTTLNGEGLQHQDGHSLLNAIAFPTVRAYDPAYVYEAAVIIFDGMKRMYEDNEDAIYYLTIENDNYVQAAIPEGDHIHEGIVRGMYNVSTLGADMQRPTVQLLGSGALLRSALAAQQLLAYNFGIGSSVWSVTSYSELAREAQACERWNRLHPAEPPRRSYLEKVIEGHDGPFIATSDYVRAVPQQIAPWLPAGMYTLGTDGLGRSDSREQLRRHFEVDAESMTVAALYQLSKAGKVEPKVVQQAIQQFDYDPDKVDPMGA
jgi:pyruvate dehydrogenase E1 component